MVLEKLRKTNIKMFRIFMSIALSLSMVAGNGFGYSKSGLIQANAKEIGEKNEVQKEGCERVTSNNPPSEYNDVISGSVFSGGNSHSQTGSNVIDEDPTDFASPLPYGDTFIDTNKLNWDTPSNFIIDIRDDRFQWVTIGEDPLVDAMGNTTTNDPMKLDDPKPLKLKATATKPIRGIFYVGPLQSYHENIADPTDDNGYTNVIEPQGDAPYLYRITYLNAVTLPNGTKGHLVLTMTKVQLETPVTVNEENPFTPDGADYSYTKAIMKVQNENQLANDTGYQFVDADGNPLNQQNTVVLTAAEAKNRMDELNQYLSGNNQIKEDDWAKDKVIRNAMGNLLDLDIEVVDAEGNPVNGTISYATHDLDFESVQNVWGRTLGNEFAEGLKIVRGSKSYALVPNYNHLDANTVATGWLPVGPGEEALERALVISKEGDGPYADGVRFASPFLANYRGADGTFNDAIYDNGALVSYQGDGLAANNNILIVKPNSGAGNNKVRTADGNVVKKQLYAMMKAKGYEGVTRWQDVTAEMAWEQLGPVFWKTYRNDSDLSFDSGFAVLLDAKKSHIQWSGSRVTGSNLHTTLFDSSIYTYVEPTHGTGGGIYIESYDIDNECSTKMVEGSTVLARNSEITVTAVPEEGYRVGRILIGDTNYGSDIPNERGLKDYKTITIDGNDVKVGGVVVGTFAGDEIDVRGHEGLKSGKVELDGFKYDTSGVRQDTEADEKIIIERNADGTVDVTLPNIDNPMHVHADFDTYYNFYKVWKDGSTPEALAMTAAPAGVYPVSVTIPMPTGNTSINEQGEIITEIERVAFEINGTTYTALNGVNKGKEFVLSPNNTVDYVEYETDPETGAVSEKFAIRSNVVLAGNEFVHYTYDGSDYVIDARYPVTFDTRVADWGSDDAKEFVIDANDPNAADYVTELDESNTISPGNKVWAVKYPSEGVEELGWPALPVEMLPTDDSGNVIDNHEAANHTDRYYWFVTEEVPGWATETYSNENAEKPGVIHNEDYYKDALWVAAAQKDQDTAEKLIHKDHEYSYAYMSVFKNGGEITNEPSIVVRGVKEWRYDNNNKDNTREDIWLHLDVKITTPEGKKIIRKDMLPPQMVAKNATENGLEKNWGTKSTYTTGDNNVKVVASTNKVPSNAKLIEVDGAQVYTGPYEYTRGGKTTTYYINELKETDADGNTYEYSIRETLDYEGDTPVEKDNLEAGLLHYVSEDVADWEDEVSANEDTYTFKYNYNGENRTANLKRYTGTVENTYLLPPKATPDETYGGKGQPQTGKPTFKAQSPKTPDGEDNEIVEVKLLDADGNPTDTVEVEDGTYTLNSDGTVTFTPHDPEYVGDPTPVQLIGTDKNGLSATTTYTPHLLDNTKTVKRTITYEYSTGDPVLDANGDPIVVEQEVTFEGVVDPKTGKVTFPSSDPNNTKDLREVDSPDLEGGWNPDRETVKKATVHPGDDDLFEIVIYNPEPLNATPDETYGLKGQPQIGEPAFVIKTLKLPDGTPNAVVDRKLIDPETGEPTDGPITIEGVGTYTLNPDGTITFDPEPDFVGNPTPIRIEGTDRLGTKARTTYTPHVRDPKDTGVAERNVHYTYETKDGEKVIESVKQTVTLTRHAKSIDQKTGEVLEWGEWEPGKFPALDNPDEEAGAVWYTNDKVDELTVNEPGTVPDEHVVYLRKTIWVTYVDEDGTTIYLEKTTEPKAANGEDQQEPDAPKKPTKKGYTFERWDRVVDDEGNITYTARWKPKTIWVTYIDGNGNKIYLEKTSVPEAKEGEEQQEPDAPKDPTKDGYTFDGWDREVDKDGNITYIARWKPKTIWVTYIDHDGRVIQKKINFKKGNPEPKGPANPVRDGYTFAGWDRVVDEEGNITYIAKWVPAPKASPDTSDSSNIGGYVAMFTLSTLIAMIGAILKKRYN